VILPGEIEARWRHGAEESRLDIDPAVLGQVVAVGEELGVAL